MYARLHLNLITMCVLTVTRVSCPGVPLWGQQVHFV